MNAHARCRSTLTALLLAVVFLGQPPAQAQSARPARPGAGYVGRQVNGAHPVVALRGMLPVRDESPLVVITHPDPDSSRFTAFVDERVVQDVVLPVPRGTRFTEAIPEIVDGEPTFGDLLFSFETPDVSANVYWDPQQRQMTMATAELSDRLDDDRGRRLAPDRRALPLQGYPDFELRVVRTVHEGAETVPAYKIDVFAGGVGPLQTITGETSTGHHDFEETGPKSCQGLPHVTDVNGDGYSDFWICDNQASNGYQTGTYWLYDPAAGLFVKDLAFWFQGSHTFDPATRTITQKSWAAAGLLQWVADYSLASGVPVLVRERTRDASCMGQRGCQATFQTRLRQPDGSMTLTEDRRGSPDEFIE